MNTDSQRILDEYLAWLREHSEVRRVADWGEITVPFLDRHNDHLQLYVRRSNGDVVFTDDGYTVADLEQSGCNLTSPKRRGLLDVTLNGFGVKLDGDALVVKASPGDAARKMHNLVQAMLAIDDLFYLAEPVVTSLFLEDVAEWLNDAGVRFTPDVKFTGKSGFDYRFDFVIPRSRVQPERALRAVNHPTNDAAKTLAFAWIDTLQTRRADSVAYALLNDSEQPVGTSVLEALDAWDIRPVMWTKRASVADEFAA
jgi:hypothetical protein